MKTETISKCCGVETYRDQVDGGVYCTICDRRAIDFVVYGVPKDGDMSDGRGRLMRRFELVDEAEEYVEQNTSPDNFERYEIREEVVA